MNSKRYPNTRQVMLFYADYVQEGVVVGGREGSSQFYF